MESRSGMSSDGLEIFQLFLFEVNMNMKMIAAACVAFCGVSAFAAVTPTCNATAAAADGVTLLKTCAPDITFYGAGATAMKGGIQAVLTTDGNVFDKTKPFVTVNLAGNSNAYAYYGFGAAGKSWAGKKVAVIINGTNGSMAGVNQLLTGLKSGSKEAGIDQQEYNTIQLHTAAAQKAGTAMPDADVTVNTVSALAPVVTLASTRVADFKTAWGTDKQKVSHMAFSDVRPSEATPGQIDKWDSKAFPAETIAMQGFGVLVNTNLYKALQARDIAAKRMAAACQDDLLTAACQPNVSTSDYTALMTGKVVSAADFLGDASEARTLTLNRRPASSGTQAATQIRFAGEANYFGKTPLATGFDMAGSETAVAVTGTTVAVNSMNVKTNVGTGDLIASIKGDAGLAIGVASLDNAASKFGASRSAQTAFFVKLDGVSPDFTGASDTALDGKYRTALQNGYSFAMEFQTLKSAKLAGDYSGIYAAIVDGLKNPAINLTGIGYIASTDASKNTAWTRGGNNLFPLNKY
jgi:opacity protein-like surface antigen